MIIGGFVVLVLGLAGIIGGGRWFSNKMARVNTGAASPTFPYSDYSMEELERLYSETPENTAVTIRTPEETHRLFVEALKKGDFEAATECCFREGDRDRIKTGLEKVKKSGELQQMINDIDQKIDRESMDSWKAVYSFGILEDGKNFGHLLRFIKTTQGVWLIESL